MGLRRVYVVVLVALGAALVLGLAERGAADTVGPVCADRPFCVSLDDQDHQSRSLDGPHYMKYELVISRKPDGGASNLTNGRATLTLTDVLPTEELRSNAVFQEAASDQRCDAGSGSSSHIVTCAVPNLPAGSAALEYKPLIFTTTSRAGATTRAVAVVSFKEKGSDNQPSDPNTDSVTVTNITGYEGLDDLDSSWAFPSASLTLQTSPTADEQHSRFGLTIASANAPAPFTAFVAEHPLTSPLNPCGAATCYGEIVETNTNGNGATLFSSTNPANVVITWDFLPSGKTKNNIVVYHQPDAGPVETAAAACVRSGSTITNLPCRDVGITRGGGLVTVTISVFAASNGSWGVG